MNKKVMTIIIAALIVVVLAIGGFMLFGRSRSVGLDSNIENKDGGVGKTTLDSDRVLVVYFSETGNTQKLAQEIYEQVGGDFRRIEPVKPYPTGQELFDYTKEERDNDERPEFKDLNINLDNYDYIFVGYPMWWYTLPMMMYTFFDTYDFSGKTIIPFNTHEGSGDGGTYETIKEFEPNATVLDGLPIRGGDMSKDQTDTVKEWLKGLGFDEKN